jgi:5-methylcytosine-specific restriction endonuclease McrA
LLPSPSADAQLAFLAKLQRLFAEGDFTATYKFALLIALADLAVECGLDTGDALTLPIRAVGDRFIQLYWSHAAPYGTGRPGAEPGVLIQNTGTQAAIVSAIAAFRVAVPQASLQTAPRHPDYKRLLSTVTQTVSAQPLAYLQNFGGGTDEFIYERAGAGRVRLKAGVSYCLRRFQPLVQQLARSHWVAHIKGNRRNLGILGDADDLEEFLFATSRQSLTALGQCLRKLEGSKCFYCGNGISGTANVDHFIPFVQYPRDLVHNFVLAHPGCNQSKSAMLAAHPHLERWLQRFATYGAALAEIGQEVGIVTDDTTSQRVAAWGYSSAQASGASAWLAPGSFERVDQRYTELFTV